MEPVPGASMPPAATLTTAEEAGAQGRELAAAVAAVVAVAVEVAVALAVAATTRTMLTTTAMMPTRTTLRRKHSMLPLCLLRRRWWLRCSRWEFLERALLMTPPLTAQRALTWMTPPAMQQLVDGVNLQRWASRMPGVTDTLRHGLQVEVCLQIRSTLLSLGQWPMLVAKALWLPPLVSQLLRVNQKGWIPHLSMPCVPATCTCG